MSTQISDVSEDESNFVGYVLSLYCLYHLSVVPYYAR